MLRKAAFLFRPFRIAAVVLVALVGAELFLPMGCIGIQAMIGKKETALTRSIKPENYRNGPNQLGLISTTADALAIWGPPKRKKRLANGHEVWRYQGSMKWRGVLVWAVVPVPLLVPTGHRKIRLEFQGDSLTRVTRQCTADRCFGIVGLEGYFNKPLFSDQCF
jgi:hypothetical protein